MSGHGYIGKTNTLLEDLIDTRIRNEREDQWGPMDGEIVAFDPAKQTATVRPFYKKNLAGVPTQVADLQEVPIEFPRAGNGAITHPVKVGDRVRLTPKMRDSSSYDVDGGAYDAASERSFNLSDMTGTVVGGDSLSSPIQNFDAANTHIRFSEDGSFGLRGSADGKFKIEGSEGNLYDILATFMELVASDQLKIEYGSSKGTGHALQNRAALMDLAAKVRAMAL